MTKKQSNTSNKERERRINIILVVLLIVAVIAMSVFFFVLKDMSCFVSQTPISSSAPSTPGLTVGDFKCSESDGVVGISGYTGSDKNITLPTSVNGKPITKVLDFAFYENTVLETVEIPEGFTDIGERVFGYCTSLREISFPSSVESLDSFVFYNCTSLSKVTFTGESLRLGNGVFDGCKAYKDVVLPKTITKIGRSCFNDTGFYLEKSNWKDGLLYLGNCLIASDPTTLSGECIVNDATVTVADWTFTENDNLKSVVFPASVKYVGSAAVAKCKNLTSIRLPAGIDSIQYAIGYDCPKLDEIVIKDGVTSIGRQAFAKCSVLRRAVIPDSVTQIDESSFKSCPNLTIECSKGSVAEQFAVKNKIPYKTK